MSEDLPRRFVPFAPLLELFKEQPPPCLYHYTGAKGLLGILKKGDHQLWASAIGFSNDASEGRYATQAGLDIVEGHPLAKDASEACRQTTESIRSLFEPVTCAWENGYVISFCEHDNVLSQWRAYGGAAGFSVGFRGLSPASLNCFDGWQMSLMKVEYDLSKQRNRLRTALDEAHVLLKDDALKDPDPYAVPKVETLLYVYVTQWACSLKHEAFSEEKEWRITVFPSYDWRQPPASYGLAGARPPLTQYPELRAHRSRLLPYVIVKPTAEKFNVESITVGPSATQSLDAKAVELLKEKLDLGDVEVRKSDIPLQS